MKNTKTNAPRKRRRSAKVARIIEEMGLPADFPLSPHTAKGSAPRWYKVIKGKRYFFGKLDDPDAALIRYNFEGPYLRAGQTPPASDTASDTLRLGDLANQWLAAIDDRPQREQVTPSTFNDYTRTMELMLDVLGRERDVMTLRPPDFTKLRAGILDRYESPTVVNRKLTNVRSCFKWAAEEEIIPHPVAMGRFKKLARGEFRERRHGLGRQTYTAEEVRALLDAARNGTEGSGRSKGVNASLALEAFILLGINGGFTQAEVAGLTVADVDLDARMIDSVRHKSQVFRKVPLWEETADAIGRAIEEQRRRGRTDFDDDAPLFLTRTGQPWVRERIGDDGKLKRVDAVGTQFDRIRDAVGIELKQAGFGKLRATHRTVTDAMPDATAARLIMGHAPRDRVEEAYIETANIDIKRLQALTHAVRRWLYEEAAGVLAKIG